MARGGNFNSSNVEGVIDPESDTWNVAKGFTSLRILRQMTLLDRYENIARFGSDEMDDPQSVFSNIAERRVEGLQRLLFTLKQLIGNVFFAIKKGDKSVIEEYLKKVGLIEQVIDGVSFIEENAITHEREIVIDETHFNKCFRILSDIKSEMNQQLNNAGLIFRPSDDVDFDRIMNEIVEGG